MEFYNHWHCKYTDIKGIVTLYEDVLKYRMITEKAKYKAKVLSFWEKHGLAATMDASPVRRSALFLWEKKMREGYKIEALNDRKKVPKTRRKRIWPLEVREKIRALRESPLHPNLGPEKIYPLLEEFCREKGLQCPRTKTIERIVADAPDKMRILPQKISHFGKTKPIKRKKVLRKPKDLKPDYPGHLVALDTIEKFINGTRLHYHI